MSIASDNNLLWVPPNISDLLTVSIDGDADDSTFGGMQVINAAASQWLTGQLDTGTYFDLLDAYGINPIEFVGEVEDHVTLLLRS